MDSVPHSDNNRDRMVVGGRLGLLGVLARSVHSLCAVVFGFDGGGSEDIR